MEEDIQRGYDIVVIARSSAAECDYSQINKALLSLLKKHDLMTKKS